MAGAPFPSPPPSTVAAAAPGILKSFARSTGLAPVATTSFSYLSTEPSASVAVRAAASTPATSLPRRYLMPLASYQAASWRSPPPPTQAWNPGRRAGAFGAR